MTRPPARSLLIAATLVLASLTAGAEIARNERIVVGLGPGDTHPYLSVFLAADSNFYRWSIHTVPWSTYVARGGGAHPAAANVDGVGTDELVVGLTEGGAGWLAVMTPGGRYGAYNLRSWIRVPWPDYSERVGETFPVAGNLDDDPAEEIVVGLGRTGGGWFAIFDDESAGHQFLGWRRLPWPAYNERTGILHPAIGDVNGDGIGEIVLGTGESGGGWLALFGGAPGGFVFRQWIHVGWGSYSRRNGATFPAAGDVDGDGRSEIAVGYGATGDGWVQILEDATGGFATASWLRLSWPDYNLGLGEVHPAIGNVDDDAREEIVSGLGELRGAGAWIEIRDDAEARYASLAWRKAFAQTVTATFPAAGRFLDGVPCPDCGLGR